MGAPGVLNRLKPKAVNFDRSTWAKRTFTSICFCRCGWATWMEFTISLEKGAAIFPIWSATAVEDAVPTRITLPSSDSEKWPRLRSEEHTSELQSPDHLVC